MTELLVVRLEEVWRDIAELCDGATPEQWDAPTDCPGWTVRDNVAHMIGTEQMLLGVPAPDIETGGSGGTGGIGEVAHVRNEIGRFNEQWVVALRGRTGPDTLAEFRAVTARRLDALRALSAEQWDEEGFTPEGRGPYRQFMEMRVFDCWYHDQDIREALDRPGFVDGPVADLTLARVSRRGMPYVVGKKAGAPPGTTVVFDVDGAVPIVAAVAVSPEGRGALVDDVPRDPTVRLSMDRRTFARLAGGRWSGARAVADGRVAIRGDQQLGRAVVDSMAFTI